MKKIKLNNNQLKKTKVNKKKIHVVLNWYRRWPKLCFKILMKLI